MKDFFENLLMHFFIMMMIPLINNFFHTQQKTVKGRVFFFFSIVLSLFLTMAFPIQVPSGFEYNLEFIPIYIAFFYLRPYAGTAAIAILLIFEWLLTQHLSPYLFINSCIITGISIWLSNYYQKLSFRLKLIQALLYYFMLTGIRYLYMLSSGNTNELFHLLIFTLVSALALLTIIYLIETNRLQMAMMEQIQNAEKMNAISQLAASIAHEIRNPMTTISGFLQIMREEKNLTSNQHLFVNLSLGELDRTQTIISDFLALARPGNTKESIFSVSDALHEIADLMRPFSAYSNVELLVHIDDDLSVKGNKNEFKQLLLNITKNGIEAMEDGGHLTISSFRSDEKVQILIRDEGHGLTKLQISQLGQPYYSTKTKGTGLGLLISFDIIKRMNGKYKVHSKMNEGTSFILNFPFVETDTIIS